MHLHKRLGSDGPGNGEGEGYHIQAMKHLKEAIANPQGRRHTFLCGDAGPLALGAVVYSKMGDERNSSHCISRYVYVTYSFTGHIVFYIFLFEPTFAANHDKTDNLTESKISNTRVMFQIISFDFTVNDFLKIHV